MEIYGKSMEKSIGWIEFSKENGKSMEILWKLWI
jgi:hypothetical protein